VADNRRFAAQAGRLNAPHLYRETDGGHDWAAWDAMLPRLLAWLFNPDIHQTGCIVPDTRI
jgi:enterochelin esterase-like enzyme